MTAILNGEWLDTRGYVPLRDHLMGTMVVVLESEFPHCHIYTAISLAGGFAEVILDAGIDDDTWRFDDAEEACWAHQTLATLCKDGLPDRLPSRERLRVVAQRLIMRFAR